MYYTKIIIFLYLLHTIYTSNNDLYKTLIEQLQSQISKNCNQINSIKTKKQISIDLVRWGFSKIGIFLPEKLNELVLKGKFVELNEIKEGDLLFFNVNEDNINQVGIYVGYGMIIIGNNDYCAKYSFIEEFLNYFILAKRLL